jgi:hypothetical protein
LPRRGIMPTRIAAADVTTIVLSAHDAIIQPARA